MLKRNKCSNEGCLCGKRNDGAFGGTDNEKPLYVNGIRQNYPAGGSFGGFGGMGSQSPKYGHGFSGAPSFGGIDKGFNRVGYAYDEDEDMSPYNDNNLTGRKNEDEDGEETFKEGFIAGTIITSVVLLAILCIVKKIKNR